MEQTADSRLMAGLPAQGRERAEWADFEAVVNLYRAKIFRFVFASLRDPDVADTLTQDCFLRAHRAWGSFRHECALDTWLLQIAVNLVRDYGRNRKLQFWRRVWRQARPAETGRDFLPDRGRSPETQALLDEQVQAVWKAAGDLPERQRTVFLLRFVEDMDLLEIAAATGMAEGTVKTHLFRAVRAVRERMGVKP